MKYIIVTFNKRGQTWSLEAFVSVMIFMFALVVFYMLTATDQGTEHLQKEAEIITKSVGAQDYFADGILDEDDVNDLKVMNCDQIKKLFQTKKNLCIYMAYEDGTLVNYDQDKPLSFGCPGMGVGTTDSGASNNCGSGAITVE